jgi:hypothetical protein
MAIKQFLVRQEFPLGQSIFLPIDPATQFGYMGTGEGGVERVRSQGRVLVPVFDWRGWGLDEEAILFKVLVEAATASPLKVPQIEGLNQAFWAKNPGVRAVLCHPANVGRFDPPIDPEVSVQVPEDRVIILKAAPMVGYYVKQAARRNILAHNKHGLLSVEFFRPV